MTKEVKKRLKRYNGAAKPMKFNEVSPRSIIKICTSSNTTTNIAPEKLISAR